MITVKKIGSFSYRIFSGQIYMMTSVVVWYFLQMNQVAGQMIAVFIQRQIL